MHNEIIVPSIEKSSIKIFNAQDVAWEEGSCDWHIHNEFEIFYLLEGAKIFTVKKQTVEMKAGDIIFVNSRVPHKTLTPIGSRGILLQFKTDLNLNDSDFDNYLFCFIDKAKADFILFRIKSDIKLQMEQCILKISEEDRNRKGAYDIFVKAYVYELLGYLYRNNILSMPTDYLQLQNISKIIPVLDYVNHHYLESVTLEEVSVLLNVDKSHFCRIFKNITNTSFINYLNFVRVYHAEILLKTTDKNIAEIAYETGFCTVSYFIKTFRKFNYCTPAKYRKILAENTNGQRNHDL
ncbi:MAG: AraC family transcriptional regulator [Lachnospiraceae bacterium]|nr:AraC family transcriptional regulator [Lachnospiraceae bacterium]